MRYKRSVNWLRKQLSDVQIHVPDVMPCSVVIEADATFFNRHEGVCIFHAPKIKKVLTYAFIESETALIYRILRNTIEQHGFIVLAAVIDGRKGIKKVFADVPVQMCQYHQLMILRHYLTMNPRLEAGVELKIICKDLCSVSRSEFELRFIQWCEKWAGFLKERTYNVDGKWRYTHRRLRSARRSLMTNLPHLFTYQDYPELEIPNTTNYAESIHSKIKDLLRVHRGFSTELKRKLIKEILTN